VGRRRAGAGDDQDALVAALVALVAALAGEWPMPTIERDVAGVLRYLEQTE
jgi:hypothetical protein